MEHKQKLLSFRKILESATGALHNNVCRAAHTYFTFVTKPDFLFVSSFDIICTDYNKIWTVLDWVFCICLCTHVRKCAIRWNGDRKKSSNRTVYLWLWNETSNAHTQRRTDKNDLIFRKIYIYSNMCFNIFSPISCDMLYFFAHFRHVVFRTHTTCIIVKWLSQGAFMWLRMYVFFCTSNTHDILHVCWCKIQFCV